jgi:hypothetical protein
MIDTGEAVKYLDIYSDELVSLSLLVRASTFQNDTDEEMCEIYESLKNAIGEKQKEAMMLAHEIVATKSQRGSSDTLANALGVNDAIRRCVLAVNQANAALQPPPESMLEAMDRIRREVAAREKAAKEANSSVSPSAVRESPSASPEAIVGASLPECKESPS